MPRNGSGTASVVNTFTPLTTADANQVNANFTDMASMITDSLPRDGQAGMTGQLLATSGTVGEPGISWNADPDTGIRRPAGDQMALVCGGADVATVTSTGVAVQTAPPTGDHLTNKTYVDAQINARGALTGEVKMWATNTAPTGYLECNGAPVSRTTYAALFAVVGTVWGSGDGSTTFNVPDMRGEFPRGWDHGRGIDTGRAFASSQTDQMQKITGSFAIRRREDGLDTIVAESGAFAQGSNGTGFVPLTAAAGLEPIEVINFDSSTSPGARAGTETRPRNIALMYIIKT